MSTVAYDINQLTNTCLKVLTKVGIDENDAKTVISSLIDAEIRGIPSHGLMRLKSYIMRIEKGLINIKPDVKIVKEKGSLLLIDGDNGLGQVVANKVLDICMDRSDDFGVTAATVKNSNHLGTCGFYTRRAAEKGYYSIVNSNAGPTMAPWGGKDPLLGTNPLAISFPVDHYEDFTLDIAVTATAKGKIRHYQRSNQDIPLGWAQDINGFDTTDATKAIEGTLLPMSGHKGYGLALAIDALCGGLNSGNLSYETESVTKTTQVAGTGHFFLTIKIGELLPLNDFKERMGDWFNTLKSSSLRDGVEEIIIPGEIENRLVKNATEDIYIQKETLEEIENLAKRL